MKKQNLELNKIHVGECVTIINSLPEKSIDLIFADPPYNLQLQNTLWRPNMTQVDAVDDKWDKFDDFQAYDQFSKDWLQACKRVLKDTGSIWVIGSYHNIYRIGKIMQDLGYWFLNDVIWIKTNPMPNFRGVRFANAHETIIWASKSQKSKYTFNHHAMKELNENEKQMRSDWVLSAVDLWEEAVCSGSERIKVNGQKAHSTQKPEALLYRVIASSSNPGDIVLDPFLGSGTTCAVAKKLQRKWIGIEQEKKYAEIAQERIDNIEVEPLNSDTLLKNIFDISDKIRLPKRVKFSRLLEVGLLSPGRKLYFKKTRSKYALIKPNGKLRLPDGFEGSIHQVGSKLMNGSPCNGWEHWYYLSKDKKMHVIDKLRKEYREIYSLEDDND